MPHRALIDHRPWLFASLAAAISYFIYADEAVPGTFLILWKGAGVGLLAIYAARRGRGLDGWLITTVLALHALGDMALELSLLAGGGLFALGHLVGIGFYLRNRRDQRTGSQTLAAIALTLATPLIAALLTYPLPGWWLAPSYALLVGAMAGSAWISRFSRYRVGLGAVLFVVSDLVIFARDSQHLPPELAHWLIWPLYYGGQFLIATGVIRTMHHGRA